MVNCWKNTMKSGNKVSNSINSKFESELKGYGHF